LICGNSVPAILARFVKLLFKPKLAIVYVSHGWGWSYQKGWKKWIGFFIEWVTFPLVNELICVSTRDYLIAKKYFFKNPKLIPNVCMKDIPVMKERNEIRRVLFVGRNVAPKRVDKFELLASSFPEYDFFVIGGLGENKSNLKYLGEKKDFRSFRDYDLLVLFSDSEGSPLVIQEALMAGLPCLINRLPYVKDLGIWKNQITVTQDLSITQILKGFEFACSRIYDDPSMVASKMTLQQSIFIQKIQNCLEPL